MTKNVGCTGDPSGSASASKFRWRCICKNTETCRQLTLLLEKEKNIRGGHVEFPSDVHFIGFAKRWCQHLGIIHEAEMEKKRFKVSRVHFEERVFEKSRTNKTRIRYFIEGKHTDDQKDLTSFGGVIHTLSVPNVPIETLRLELKSKLRKLSPSRTHMGSSNQSQHLTPRTLSRKRKLSELRKRSVNDLACDLFDASSALMELESGKENVLFNPNTKRKKSSDDAATKEENKMLKLEIGYLHDEIKALREKVSALENQSVKKLAVTSQATEVEVCKGLSLKNLVSDEWHADHPTQARNFFGYESWEVTKCCIDSQIDQEEYLTPELMNQAYARKQKALNIIKKKRISMLKDCVVCLLKMRKGFSSEDLMTITSWGKKRINKCLSKYIPLLGKAGKALCNFELNERLIERLRPPVFDEAGLGDVAIIGDGKDIQSYEFRAHSALRRAQHSNKTQSACARGLSWATGDGLYVSVTDLFLARTTEQKLFALHAKRFDWLPSKYSLLYDKGLKNCSHYLPNMNKIRTPNFLGRRTQFSQQEISDDREKAKLRYTIEVGYSRVATWALMRDQVNYHNMKYVNDCWAYAHASANHMKPLRQIVNR